MGSCEQTLRQTMQGQKAIAFVARTEPPQHEMESRLNHECTKRDVEGLSGRPQERISRADVLSRRPINVEAKRANCCRPNRQYGALLDQFRVIGLLVSRAIRRALIASRHAMPAVTSTRVGPCPLVTRGETGIGRPAVARLRFTAFRPTAPHVHTPGGMSSG